MASLEAAARDWLTDPAWNKLFKNIFDIAEDQICRGLVALAAISLAVRFLANLPSGDLLCIVIGFDINGTFGSDVRDLAGPWHATLTAYAAQDPGCYEAVFVHNNHPIKVFIFKFRPPNISSFFSTDAWFHCLRTNHDDDASCFSDSLGKSLDNFPQTQQENGNILQMCCRGNTSWKRS